MVNLSRDQSHEQPSRSSWPTMVLPDSSFHCHTRLMNASRPMARRFGSWRSSNWRSTTIWVAMPA